MATLVSQKVYGFRAGKAVMAASKEIGRLESLLSFFMPQSEISAINAGAGLAGGKIRISPETFRVLEKSMEIKEESLGVFDITMGSLFALWRKALSDNILPDSQDIEKARQSVETSNIELTGPDTAFLELITGPDTASLELITGTDTAFLKEKGLQIDPGAIGKGFIADKAVEIYRRHRIKSAFISIGGNVSLLGAKPDGSPWRVGITDPDSPDSCIGYLSIENSSVVTSGDYEKYTTINGRRYHHIIDIRTGYPAESGLRSVTVVSEKSILADALATAAFILGLKEGRKLLASYRVEGLFIDSDRKIHLTPGLKTFTKLSDPPG